jgi:GH15 family glucan-1,4-alpha-glucosidase
VSEPREPPRVYALRDYALLADGERGALVDPDGNVSWMCAPRWHDPALFSVLIGGEGVYTVTPAERFVWGGYYEPGTLIWRSRWTTNDAVVECREALARPASAERLVLLRRIEVRAGSARLRVRLDARADFDRHRMSRLRLDEHGIWHGAAGDLRVLWLGGADAHAERDRGLELELQLNEGEHHDLVLAVGDDEWSAIDPDALWRTTATAWQESVPALANTLARRDAEHAVAVMSGLTAASGGMVAAATMSLPEEAREQRNYDYRYAWIRDGCYAGQAAAKAGALALMDAALGFARERLLEHGDELRPAYTVDGGPVPEEAHVDLPGYPGGSDIIGNRVTTQFQLDAFGEIMLLIAAAAAHDRLQAEDWRAAELAADAVRERWQQPDAGVWELDPDEWTQSRLSAAAGLRALAGCAPPGAAAAGWSSLADAIVADCSARALHPSGRWQRSPGDERIDASLLLPALRGALPAHDPRSVATLHAVLEELGREHFVYRYRIDRRPLGEAEGAFVLCGLWAALACHQQGADADALRFFERARSSCGSPGLLSEEHDISQRQQRGNLPQAFVHALLLECSATLA